ncbi:hypothetical protein PF004_g14446 [Phytophthora fragariae]|uniref:Uncharacterized protein n=1 Tax=Phytophthora fragariae TaxID=53985 RepID=A0A6G0NPB6_9STRA|nr:hypothetical protein PF004_g14446 [Phytophthora fragariae]
MTVHHPGAPVVGKTKKTRLKHETVVAVFKDSRHHTYDVRWGNGVVERVSARSIAAHEATEAVSSSANAPESPEKGPPARDSAASPTGTDCPLCDCEDLENDAESAIVDEENVENLESGEIADGYVIANERLWSPCFDVLKDVVDHVTRRAAIHRPEVLQLGVRSAVKYCYLFYPMQTLQSTVA